MATYAEQIGAFESKRAANLAAMDAIMSKAAEEGTTLDAEQQEQFDDYLADNETIDSHLKRLRAMEKAAGSTAKPVQGDTEGAATQSRSPVVEIVRQPKLEPGVRFARLAKVKTISRLDNKPAEVVAERMYGADSEIVAILKDAVVAGSTADGNWASALVGSEGSAFADFAAFLRPATILGQFGTGGVPALRQVPFRVALVSQTGGGAGYWVGEGKPKPLTAFDFSRTTMEPLKVANIAVLTEEVVRDSSPSAEMVVRDALRDALVQEMDTAFSDPSNGGSPNVKPASIFSGAAAVAAQVWTDADDIRIDVRALFQKFIDANNAPSSGVWIMSATNALALSLLTNALGQREFPGVSMLGGTFEGMPVITSQHVGDIVALVNASDIYQADAGGVSVDMSREASVEMLDSSLVQDSTAGTGASLVSLWQSNLVGLRAERTINWMRRRPSAVAYLTGVAWGGPVPAS